MATYHLECYKKMLQGKKECRCPFCNFRGLAAAIRIAPIGSICQICQQEIKKGEDWKIACRHYLKNY